MSMDASRAFSCALCGAPCGGVSTPAPAPSSSLPARKPARLRQPCACASCGVIVYCSEAHRRIHSQLPGDGGGHDAAECSRMAHQLQRGLRLATSLPFSWARGLCRLPDLKLTAGMGQNSPSNHAEAQPRGAAAAAAGQQAAAESIPSGWREVVGRRSSVCEILAASGSHVGQRRPAGDVGPPGAGGTDAASTGGQCRAEGMWRRLCTCRPADELPPWGSCQPPQLALLRVAGVPGAGGATDICSSGAWDHATWAHKVWGLPAALAPLLKCRATAPAAGASAPTGSGDAGAAAAALASRAHYVEPYGQPTTMLAATESPRSQPPACSSAGMSDWRSYYQWAGLPLASPVALLLHFPLTLLRALSLADARTGGLLLGANQGCSSGHSRGKELHDSRQPLVQVKGDGGLGGRSAKRPRFAADQGDEHAHGEPQQLAEQEAHRAPAVHSGNSSLPGSCAAAADATRIAVDVLYLGPQAELDCLDCFAALLPLLPRACTLRVRMVGPNVPPDWHGAEVAYDSSSIHGAGITGTPTEAADGLAGTRNVSGEGEDQRSMYSSSTRIEFTFWSCSLHEAPEALLRDCLSTEPRALSEVPMPCPFSAAPIPARSPAAGDEVVEAAAGKAPLSGVLHGSSAASTASRAPLVVLAPNAGLPAYMSWMPSLELLVAASRPVAGLEATPDGDGAGASGSCDRASGSDTPGVAGWRKRLAAVLGSHGCGGGADSMRGSTCRPVCCLFTAFNEEEVLRSEQLLSQLYGVVPDVACCENPFRQPLWCVERAGNALPSFSNGFMFGWCGGGW